MVLPALFNITKGSTGLIQFLKGAKNYSKNTRFNIPKTFDDTDILNYLKLDAAGATNKEAAIALNTNVANINNFRHALNISKNRLNKEINAGNIRFGKDVVTTNYKPIVGSEREVASLKLLRKKQFKIDTAAAKFDPENPQTWKGLTDSHGDARNKSLQFVLPSTKYPEARKFVTDDIKVRTSKSGMTGPGSSVDTTKTWPGFVDKFGVETKGVFIKNPGIAVTNLKNKFKSLEKFENEYKSIYGAGTGADKNNKAYSWIRARRRIEQLHAESNPDKQKYLLMLKDRKKVLQNELGVKNYTDSKALEIEHTNSIVDILRSKGVTGNIDDLSDDFLKVVADEAMDLTNLSMATRGTNLLKAKLFESTKHPNISIITRNLKVDSLKAQGKIQEAIKLENAIKKDVVNFQKTMEKEAIEGLAVPFNFTKNDWLPRYAQIKNSYKTKDRLDLQLLDELNKNKLTPYYDPKLTKDFYTPPKVGRSRQPVAAAYEDGGKVVSAAHKANPFELGGLVGRKEKFGGVSGSNFKGIGQTNKVGTIHSMLAGIGAGIIDIPKGAFSLGASLVDLGLGTDHAAKVEKFFNDLTNLDEKAEESFAGEMTRIITNLGIPGSQAFKIGSRLTKQALVARKKNQYFDLTDKKMEARMQDALNSGGRLLTTAGGAAGIGVSDAIFVGDPEQVGTIGDMFGGGPTALNPNDEDNAAREVMNRMKFGLESSLLAGIIGGTGSAIKTAVKRSGERDYANSTIDKIFSKFRPRGNKPQQFFDMERGQIGIRQADVNRAQEIQRGVDKHIDAIFPQLKNTFNKTTQETRSKLLKDLNETLLSGDPEISGVTGEFKFGAMDPSLLSRDTARLRKLGAKNPKAIFDSFYDMRAEWNDMFSALGTRMDPKSRAEFGKTFGQKMSDYLGSTYEIFQKKGLIPITQFKPGEEALAKATAMFKQSAKEAGEEITDEQAESYAMQVIKSARLPKGIATGAEKSSNAYFKAPDFFINKTVLSDLEFKGMVNLAELTPESRKVIDNLLGKIEDPTQTILGGTARLSMITRRNQFLDDLLKASDEAKVDKKDGFFYTDEREAINVFGAENVRKIEMDPGKTLEAGKTNPLNGLYAHKGVAEALEQTSQNILGESALANVYTNFILYPKAASQLAKTVLSPVTHVRNFVSAGAFAAGNGIIPNAEAFKTAYKSLQVPLKGSREQNEFYRKLLRLGVVNSNVRLGDLQNLLSDVKFGSSSATIPGLRRLAKQGSRLKKGAEEFYTAEDDFWKITSFAMERQRYADAYKKAGIVKSADELDEIAADIVRNNIPNYDYVNDFVKGLRKFPIGNFVSFPAEIMRTSGNILHRAFKEINFKQTLADGRVIKPLSGIGYKRLMGFGATAVVIPTGVVEGAKAIYDVSGAEMDALRRFVPDWSKNSTLIPIRDEDGSLKYIDFSHANAYDTMIRPFMTMKNAIQDGAEDEAPVMQSVFKGLYEGIGETISPFVSEAIWTQAATDIFLRGGRTKTGQRLYTDQTPFGEKASIIASHLVETQLPGSIGTFERLGLAVTSKPDEYGREYELTDEALGFMGMRAVKVDPITSMKFKIADYTTGVNNSRREFTRPLLKGGPVTPEQIVDRYMVANEQLFNVQKNMNKDYYAARILGSNQDALNLEFKDRISNVALNAIKAGQFKPFIPSENILKSFAENARNIGQTNPYENARDTIDRLARQYSKANVMFGEFPFNDNPFTKVEESSLPTSGMGDTNVTLPNLGLNIQGSNLGSVNNLGTTLAKLEQVDKVFDL
jgi:hypothetical protein